MTVVQVVLRRSVTLEQRARTSMAAVGPQVQLLVLQMYLGVAHGLDWSLLKSEL